ncbi:MAG: apolipoprotein N-acyltransferase [Akkermansiaceae bacterium]|jgi:apolipoprotein N-acyltransferase
MRAFLRPLGAAASGGALALCFAPFDQIWLVWGFLWLLLPLLWTVKPKRASLRGFGLGYLCGFVFWVINLKWIGTVTGLGVFTFAIYLGLYFGIFGAFAAKAGNPWLKENNVQKHTIKIRLREMGRSLGYAALLGGLWCGLEWIRGWMLTGFGWNGLGVTFAKSLILAQNAEFVGVIGLSFLPVFVSVVVVQTARRFWQQALSGGVKLLHWDFATALLVMMLAFTMGTIRLSTLINAPKIEARVLLIQQDIPQVAGDVLWEPEAIVDGFIELTEKGLEQVEVDAARSLEKTKSEEEVVTLRWPDFVIWPEACLPAWFRIQEDGRPVSGPGIEGVLEYVGGLKDFTLITGVNEIIGDDPMAKDAVVYNSLLTRTSADERQSYQKNHLVYFGEALPDFQFFYDIYEQTAGVPFRGGLTPGGSFEPLTVKIGEREVGLIPSICFEDTVPRVTRKFVRNGPQVIVNLTNDGWFHESEGGVQHFRNAIFRSIELRRPMVRCANRGVTGVISVTGSTVDPYSRENRELVDENGSHFHRGFLLASAYLLEDGGVTLYAAFGDWFAVTGLIFAIIWGLFGFVNGLCRKSRDPA